MPEIFELGGQSVFPVYSVSGGLAAVGILYAVDTKARRVFAVEFEWSLAKKPGALQRIREFALNRFATDSHAYEYDFDLGRGIKYEEPECLK